MRTLQARLIVDRACSQSAARAGDGDEFGVMEEPVEEGCRGYAADELAPLFQRAVDLICSASPCGWRTPVWHHPQGMALHQGALQAIESTTPSIAGYAGTTSAAGEAVLSPALAHILKGPGFRSILKGWSRRRARIVLPQRISVAT